MVPTMTPKAPALTDAQYHAAADAVLARVEACVDNWLQADVIDIDAHRTGGMLELALPNGSRLVINKQPPLHELWLAARDGGYHYRLQDGQWRDTRDGSEFFAVLSARASAQSGQALHFSAS